MRCNIMCMKNVNLTVTYADIIGNKEDNTISLLNINKSFPITYDDENNRIIEKLTMALFINAVETKDKKSLKNADPRTKMIFSNNYRFGLRLTESHSGNFTDLGEFSLRPNDTVITDATCCDIFKHTRLCVFDNIELPPKHADEFFVIKLLIKPISDEETNDGDWIVQTVCPILFSEEKKSC